MKRISILFIALIASAAVLSAQENTTTIEFAETTHNFGNIQESAGDATCEFNFTNTGKTPLIITRVTSSCGCTAPSYPKEPISASEKGIISVTYHANGRPGGFAKNITVYANTTPESTLLQIKGNVIPEITQDK
ncbi:MAG: DUF1573 domain-containing protein [Bacteroidales bacterium]